MPFMNQVVLVGRQEDELVACHECDALQRVPKLRPGQTARCGVCRATLLKFPKGGLDRPIALYLSALILLVLSNSFPFLMLEIQGRQETTTILGASQALYNAGMGELAVAVFVTSILAPALLIGSSLYVLLAVRFRLPLPAARVALSWISHLEPWGMLDVFMLGVLVAFVKLGNMATMHTGIALFAFCGLIVVSAAAAAAFEPRLLWQQMSYRKAGDARH
jgi:paraquat-inducible protein A